MNTYNYYKKFLCFSAILFSCVSYAEINIPPNNELRTLMKSYNNDTGETGGTIGYIPIKKPCVNFIYKNKYTEYCFVNKDEDLSNSDKMGFYVRLENISNGRLNFSYNTPWYSKYCRISDRKESRKLTCKDAFG